MVYQEHVVQLDVSVHHVAAGVQVVDRGRYLEKPFFPELKVDLLRVNFFYELQQVCVRGLEVEAAALLLQELAVATVGVLDHPNYVRQRLVQLAQDLVLVLELLALGALRLTLGFIKREGVKAGLGDFPEGLFGARVDLLEDGRAPIL